MCKECFTVEAGPAKFIYLNTAALIRNRIISQELMVSFISKKYNLQSNLMIIM